MAIKFEKSRPLNAVEVVSELDDSIDMEASDWEGYKATGDMAKLKFVAGKQPTIFLCNFDLKGKEGAQIKNAMIDGQDDEGKPKIALGSWSFKVAKYVLKDIKNPADVPAGSQLVFKKDQHGYAHDDVIAELDKVGIVNELFAMYSTLVLGGARAHAKN